MAGGRSPVIGVCGQLGGRNFYTKKKMRIRLRRIVAELTPDKQILQDVMRKYSGGSQTKLSAVTFIQQVLA
ncbi:transposase [Herbaspirillum seropedicae]|nr:transposase [Herbaspirillum seropedicae]